MIIWNYFLEILPWLGDITNLASFLGISWGLIRWIRQTRKIKIVAVCKQKRKFICSIPANLASRSEISGMLAQNAKGVDRLDLSGFDYNYYKIDAIMEVPLNQEDFDRIIERPRE